jgi:hypothetical protein
MRSSEESDEACQDCYQLWGLCTWTRTHILFTPEKKRLRMALRRWGKYQYQTRGPGGLPVVHTIDDSVRVHLEPSLLPGPTCVLAGLLDGDDLTSEADSESESERSYGEQPILGPDSEEEVNEIVDEDEEPM